MGRVFVFVQCMVFRTCLCLGLKAAPISSPVYFLFDLQIALPEKMLSRSQLEPLFLAPPVDSESKHTVSTAKCKQARARKMNAKQQIYWSVIPGHVNAKAIPGFPKEDTAKQDRFTPSPPLQCRKQARLKLHAQELFEA